MGVSGSGKSTVGKLLAEDLNIPFFDGDDFHPKSNIIKMSRGQALTDEDRFGWLQSLNSLAKKQLEKNSCIIVCSALKNKYRELLSKDIQNNTKWIFLQGSFEEITNRINKRKNHFMNSEMLKSQFDILEEPKDAIKIDINLKPKEIIALVKNQLESKSEFGLFGLGVMGKSLCRNLANNGFKISMFNRHIDGLEVDVAKTFKTTYSELSNALTFDDIPAFVNSLEKPRKIMLMVNAGKTIDDVIEDLLPHLSKKDILIDGGNSNYLKTKERYHYLKTKSIHFMGAGVSGGEEGALKGPSIMLGGNENVYSKIQPFLEGIAAKDKNNLPCCSYIGNDGSGHFVKMVHNGIEYVEMQLLSEVVTILKSLKYNPDEIANTLASWQETADSYLLEITIDILRKKEGEIWLVDKIMDKAENKGTGNWATIASAELGVPSTMIAISLFARYSSFYKNERIEASKRFKSSADLKPKISKEELLEAYQFARIMNHYQGFKLIHQASETYDWKINLSELSRIWTGGCIIKSNLMIDLVEIFKENQNILKDKKITSQLLKLKPSIKKVVSECVLNDIALPNLSESINFLNNFAIQNSSANIIQAQRDYFGAHRYQLKDDKTEKFYHTEWK